MWELLSILFPMNMEIVVSVKGYTINHSYSRSRHQQRGHTFKEDGQIHTSHKIRVRHYISIGIGRKSQTTYIPFLKRTPLTSVVCVLMRDNRIYTVSEHKAIGTRRQMSCFVNCATLAS